MEREEVWDFFWDENLDVELLSIGEHHVDVLVKDQDKNLKWRGTFVYGEPRVQDRHLMWERMRMMKNKSSAPWMMIGDFNEVCGRSSISPKLEEKRNK